jgi:cyclase
LLIEHDGLVKTVGFKDPTYVGDPVNAVRIFNEKEVDELILLDISATRAGKQPNFSLIGELASECFMPIAYGGGISSIDQIERLLQLGIEKVVLNTCLYRNPTAIEEAAAKFGSQAIVVSIDARRKFFGGHEVFAQGGSLRTGMNPVDAARLAEGLGAGEIMITSIDADGKRSGYDLGLTESVARSVRVPVIASGGAGCLNDFRLAVRQCGASAVAAGSMFVFHGPHRAVLISYPRVSDLHKLFLGGPV